MILAAFVPDTRADKPVRSLHRKVGPRDVYLVMDAPKHSTVEFRAKGRVELWDPWTGATQPLRVLGETATGTKVEMPLEDYEAQVVVFTPGRAARQSAAAPGAQPCSRRIALGGDWEFELQPTMDNRYGDFRLPATDKIIGPEARIFRHAIEDRRRTGLATSRLSTTADGSGSPTTSARSSGCWDRCRPRRTSERSTQALAQTHARRIAGTSHRRRA